MFYCKDLVDFVISTYGKFPDLPIGFCGKRINTRLDNNFLESISQTQVEKNNQDKKFGWFSVFGLLFWSHYWWRHWYDSSKNNFGSWYLESIFYYWEKIIINDGLFLWPFLKKYDFGSKFHYAYAIFYDKWITYQRKNILAYVICTSVIVGRSMQLRSSRTVV